MCQILSKRYERLRLFKFPPKKWFSSLARGTIDKRRKAFESYLQELVRGWGAAACVVCAAALHVAHVPLAHAAQATATPTGAQPVPGDQ